MELRDIYHAYMVDGQFEHLRNSGAHFVPGDGNPNARVLFVGEAPGETEDKRRLPFQGASGRILNRYLKDIGLERDEVFVTNVLKYRPPHNRAPNGQEINESLPYIGEELLAVNPDVVVLLGRIATRAFFPGQDFPTLRGLAIKNGIMEATVVVTYHPAAVIYNRSLDRMMQAHYRTIKGLLDS